MTINNKINLDDGLLIGKGRDRACYAHPAVNNTCKKVALKPEKQTQREIKYLSFLRKKGKKLSFISQFIGPVQTDFGMAYQYELVRDKNGNIAPTLKQAINNKLISKQEVNDLVNRLHTLLIKESICVYDLSPSNIVIFLDERNIWQFKIIDGIGVPNANPFTAKIEFLTAKLIHASYKRLIAKINKTFIYQELNTRPEPKKREPKFVKNIKKLLWEFQLQDQF